MTTVSKQKNLYLVSTPLNVLLAVAHASALSDRQVSELVLIDQRNIQNNLYLKALNAFEKTPFQNVEITSGSAKGTDKLAERKQVFLQLEQLVKRFKPDVVTVGSDRRIEFQYVMNLLNEESSKGVEGWYLDDGLYSYAGRPKHWFKDTVNSILKKLVYGFWWDEPKTVGASNWIDQAWLFHPEQAVSELKAKKCRTILTEWFTSPAVMDFSGHILNILGLSQEKLDEIQAVELILIIPHPDNIKKIEGYEENILNFLELAAKQNIRVAVKYHPRTGQLDPLCLVDRFKCLLIPSELAFEFVLPFLSPNSTVVGDVGTSLLTSGWLRPDVKCCAVIAEEDAYLSSFGKIYDDFGIERVRDFGSIIEKYNSSVNKERVHD
ncbi:hypothetical protein QCB45_11235 [Thiomicrorhabdus sp. ZW0627]|uniref:hypothetical protein n=1 Tax=Thiomicrorhabdus sp. ZW0627 TaxID=3039774 RepID=UPI002436E4E7|nr:hypothetical protein [Thiomicrorhabdus sp. ZW0627]MDG6774907.1 hypothetical protein [Thiomicrorhabdus sp. ZW0627]